MSDPADAVVAPESAPAHVAGPTKRVSVVCSTDGCVVSATSLTKRYKLGKENFVDALRGASLHIRPGEMVAIMGPSGSGKSTMMHMIGCLDTPDAGEVWIGGRRADTLRGKALTRLRSQEIGFIFQGFNLIPTLSAAENVALAAEYAGRSRGGAAQQARELLDLVGLGDRAGHLPSELSGGQQQRVAIARSLINEPSVVLGDEPTGDLDTKTSDEIVEMMRTVNLETGTTFILVTHNPEVAEACDRTILMRDGIVHDDDYDEAEREADATRRADEARERKKRIREARDTAKAKANVEVTASDSGEDAVPSIVSEPIRRRVLISGLVQGVYFRQSAVREASALGVAGWVRNLPDGRVEAVFEGPSELVEAAVAWSRHGPARADVEDVEIVEEHPEGLSAFRQRY